MSKKPNYSYNCPSLPYIAITIDISKLLENSTLYLKKELLWYLKKALAPISVSVWGEFLSVCLTLWEIVCGSYSPWAMGLYVFISKKKNTIKIIIHTCLFIYVSLFDRCWVAMVVVVCGGASMFDINPVTLPLQALLTLLSHCADINFRSSVPFFQSSGSFIQGLAPRQPNKPH